MKKFIKENWLRLSIPSLIFLIALFFNFSVKETKAYYDCSQYGTFAYSDGTGYCKCMSGYIMSKNFLGDPYCVSGSAYCYDNYGLNSNYDSLSKSCECNRDFILKSKPFGGYECISGNQACENEYGYSAGYDSLTGKCNCDYGYVWGKDSIGGTECVSMNTACKDQLGYNAKYNTLSGKCECTYGYVISENRCVDGDTVCHSKHGFYSSYNDLDTACECDSGYTLDTTNQCVKKQNNVYFTLKEVDTSDKMAIIKSEYDYQNYLIKYGIGCLNSSINRYRNNRIVINLGTDFYVDMFDKIVLFDDDETCDIMSVKKVNSDFSLVPPEEIYTSNYYIPDVIQNIIIPEGAIIRATDDIDVYIVKYVGSKKFKRLVLSPSVFNNYGHLKWENLMVVSRETVDSFITSDLVRAVGDSKIYRLYPQGDTGQKRLIKDNAVLTKFGLDSESIYEINSFDRESYTTGAILE